LLDAALALFGERGYANAPIELICTTAKVATRHFYEQFKGREELLSAIFDQIMEGLGQQISNSMLDGDEPLAKRVSNAIGGGTLYLLDDARRARVICLESVGVSPAMERRRREALHQLASVIESYCDELHEAGLLPARNYHFPSVGLVGMMTELIVEWLVEDTGLTAGELSRETVILFRAMIVGAQNYRDGGPG
jgi:AcrR family transcriptional regulator